MRRPTRWPMGSRPGVGRSPRRHPPRRSGQREVRCYCLGAFHEQGDRGGVDSRSMSSDGHRPSCSSATCRPWRLVARIAHRRRAGQDVLDHLGGGVAGRVHSCRPPAAGRGPPGRRPHCRPRLSPGCWMMPSTAANASGTAAGSATGASSITHTPSGNSRPSGRRPPAPDGSCPPRRDRSASPPDGLSQRLTSPSSFSRPIRLVVGTRRFPDAGSWVVSGGNSVRRPGARTWNTCTGSEMSRSRRDPRSTRSTPLQQTRRVAIQQDLPAMPGGHHPGRPVQHRTEVVRPPQLGLPGRDPHPDRQFQHLLGGDRSVDGGPG